MVTLDIIDQSIILILNYIQGMKGKKYSIPSQLKILELLRCHYRIVICLRTLNYHLAKLEKLKYIYRKRRNPLTVLGKRIYQSTMYSLAASAYRYLSGFIGSFKNGYYSFKKHLQSSFISSRKEREETQRYFSHDENIRRFKELRATL